MGGVQRSVEALAGSAIVKRGGDERAAKQILGQSRRAEGPLYFFGVGCPTVITRSGRCGFDMRACRAEIFAGRAAAGRCGERAHERGGSCDECKEHEMG